MGGTLGFAGAKPSLRRPVLLRLQLWVDCFALIEDETRPVKMGAAGFLEVLQDAAVELVDVLVGGRVLPGFRLPLADVFASDRPRKKKPH